MYIIDFVVLKVKVIQGTSYSFFCKKKMDMFGIRFFRYLQPIFWGNAATVQHVQKNCALGPCTQFWQA